jgi:Short-chain dehydrogenases of various substrate specificities
MNGYRTALVTGASRGIGEAVAVALAEAGLDVALFARSEGDLARVAERVRATGRDVLVLAGDVTREEDVEGAVREVEARWGAVDVLVNNAGIGVFKPTWEIAADEWRRVLDVNLTGPFLFCKAVVPGMIARGRGQIVMISSDVGRRTIPDGAAYCASKFGLQALTEVLRKEVRAKGVKVGPFCRG